MYDESYGRLANTQEIMADLAADNRALGQELIGLRQRPGSVLADRVHSLLFTSAGGNPAHAENRPGGQRSRRAMLSVFGAALGLTVLLLLLVPAVRVRAAQIALEVAHLLMGVTTSRTGFITFSPPPPFVVMQPDQLADGWRLVAQRYAAAAPGGSGASAEPGLPTGPSNLSAMRQAVELPRGDFAHIVLGYEGPDDRYFVLFERPALPGEPLPSGTSRRLPYDTAVLVRRGALNALVWVSEGTWIELEGNLPEDELVQVAARFVASQSPGPAPDDNSPEGMTLTSYEIPRASVEEAQAQVDFHMPTFAWVPEGFELGGAHVTPPNWANIFYTPTDPALAAVYAGFGLSITRGPESGTQSISGTERQADLLVDGQPAEYWAGLKVGSLRWETDGFVYRLSYSGFELSREEVQRLAESLR